MTLERHPGRSFRHTLEVRQHRNLGSTSRPLATRSHMRSSLSQERETDFATLEVYHCINMGSNSRPLQTRSHMRSNQSREREAAALAKNNLSYNISRVVHLRNLESVVVMRPIRTYRLFRCKPRCLNIQRVYRLCGIVGDLFIRRWPSVHLGLWALRRNSHHHVQVGNLGEGVGQLEVLLYARIMVRSMDG
ncbi:hypothetical protein HYPSUDRAFT_976680 [Hypholoma sublateritium FD-334 SS-4]|uniref:Uncharacterized protein n=1 Tax=Hypholoma sublateritium (strain FD-334 SS-4) TaxID=945553 RepID=A0A0D2NG25_HYPSF|nr:hypothetical protein HYPSUDRAFT_976680 [Hypholoma sublateritium FD-334 SS-4]